MHLIDTSVWIDFLRGRQTPRGQLLESLLEDGEAFLCEITYAEICFGAKNQKQFEKYSRYFSELPFLTLPSNWHNNVSKMGFQLRLKGFKPFIADLLIATTALHHRSILLTEDSDFKPYQELFDLNIA